MLPGPKAAVYVEQIRSRTAANRLCNKGVLKYLRSIDSVEMFDSCADGKFKKHCDWQLIESVQESEQGFSFAGYGKLLGVAMIALAIFYIKKKARGGQKSLGGGPTFHQLAKDSDLELDDIDKPRNELGRREIQDSQSATVFMEKVLMELGIPQYGFAKYTSMLKQRYLHSLDQLQAMDAGDWKALGLPLVIEEALRKALVNSKQISWDADVAMDVTEPDTEPKKPVGSKAPLKKDKSKQLAVVKADENVDDWMDMDNF